MWLSPITDRTLEDVRYAESKVVEWIAAYSRGETPMPAVTIVGGYEASWRQLSSRTWDDMSDTYWGDLTPTVPDLKGCVNS